MTLEVHVAGPGLDVTRRLEPGEPALILGRDGDCGICLPDPERGVSRRHLSLWNEGDQLHFHVLSVVNGVQTLSGELPPGARGVLPPGDRIALATFRVTATPVAPAQPPRPEFMDTWSQLQHEAEQLGPAGEATRPPQEEDPFGDWGFGSTFGAGRSLSAQGLAPATDLQPFFAGLGLEPAARGQLTQGELEAIGRLARMALQALLEARQAAAQARQALRAEEPPPAQRREPNLLRTEAPLEAKLAWLFGGPPATGGGLPAEAALAQLAGELVGHEQALAEAVQEALRGVLADFEPEALRKRLLGGGARLFGAGRAWEAFVREHAGRGGAEDEAVRQLLDRHFARAYARALLRAKRNTPGRSGA